MEAIRLPGIKLRYKVVCSFLLILNIGFSQSLRKNFHQLSRPEKHWVLGHPFVAKKAWHCTQRARLVTDSLQKKGVLKDANGGQLDAFRHAYWMALLVQHISPRKADRLGKAHEKGNYLDFKKGKTEDSLRADSMMCVMDLKNDSAGIRIGKTFRADTAHTYSLERLVVKAVLSGKLVMIKKSEDGKYIDKEGRLINLALYEGKWSIPKCLVRSDYKTPRPLGEQR